MGNEPVELIERHASLFEHFNPDIAQLLWDYRRDGLPINAETAIGLQNKERVEILKGTSGVQAGVSAPGGLVNMIVKRPTERLRQVGLGLNQEGGVEAHVDWAKRFGDAGQFGLRVNLAADYRVTDPLRAVTAVKVAGRT